MWRVVAIRDIEAVATASGTATPGRPIKLAAALIGESGGGDCLAQAGHGPETLVNPEPGFFILGSKSYGRNSQFLLRVGWEQVDQVFSLIAGEPG